MSPSWHCPSSTASLLFGLWAIFFPKTKLKLTTPKKAALIYFFLFFVFFKSVLTSHIGARPESTAKKCHLGGLLLFETELLGFVLVDSGSALCEIPDPGLGEICACFVVTFYNFQTAQKNYGDLFFPSCARGWLWGLLLHLWCPSGKKPEGQL